MTARRQRKPTLTEQQQAFVREYMVDGNGKQAAIRAGYSVRTAESQASRLLAKVKLQQALAQAVATAEQQHGDAPRKAVELALADLAKIAAFRLGDLLTTDAHGRPDINLKKARAAEREGLVALKVTRSRWGRGFSLRAAHKLRALDILQKFHASSGRR